GPRGARRAERPPRGATAVPSRGPGPPALRVLLALPLELSLAGGEEHVERGEAAVAARDVAVELQLLLGSQRGVRVDLLLEDAEPVAHAQDLFEEDLEGNLLRLRSLLAGDQLEGAADPAAPELQLDVNPAVVAEHLSHRARDPVDLRLAAGRVLAQVLERE